MSKPLLHTQTGGASFLSFIFLAAGLVALLFQILIFASPSTEEADSSLWSKFIIGGLGLVFIILFFMSSRKGWLEIYPDKVKGKIAGGNAYEIALAKLGEVDLRGRGVHFKDGEGKTIVLDKTPRYRQAPGLVWILKQYPDIDLGQWDIGNSSDKMPPALRLFYDEEKPLFGDRGFIYTLGESVYFFPDTPTAPVPSEKEKASNTGLSPYSNQQFTVPRFDPDPSKLPLESILRTLNADNTSILMKLVEGHGGMELKEVEQGKYEGNLPGWRTVVTSRTANLSQ